MKRKAGGEKKNLLAVTGDPWAISLLSLIVGSSTHHGT